MTKKSNNKDVYGERIAKLEAHMENMVKDLVDIRDNHLVTMNKKLDGLARMFETRLPIWVSTLITLLISGCVGLFILYLTAINKL